MKRNLSVALTGETFSLITDICYAHVPAWYGETERPLRLSLLLPKHKDGHAKLPLIVFLCGGAFRQMDRNVWIPQLMDYARAGFVVASAEYRVSSEAPFPAALIDVKAAIRFLKAHAERYCIDAENVTAMGESAGGTLACLAGVTSDCLEYEQGDHLQISSGVQQVVDFYGITDMLCDPICRDGENGRVIDDFLGDAHPETARAASALSYVKQGAALPRFMILHGDADALVPQAQSDRLHDALIAAGHTPEYLLLEGAAHGEDVFFESAVDARIIEWLRNHK